MEKSDWTVGKAEMEHRTVIFTAPRPQLRIDFMDRPLKEEVHEVEMMRSQVEQDSAPTLTVEFPGR
jgi:hypothetical protein